MGKSLVYSSAGFALLTYANSLSATFIFFLWLNFGSVSINELESFISLGLSGIAGVDLQVQVEFALLVLLLPLLGAMVAFVAFYRLGSRPTWAAYALSAAVVANIFSALVVIEPNAVGMEKLPQTTAKPSLVYSEDKDYRANLVHIFVESLASDLIISGESITEPQDTILKALGPYAASTSLLATDVGGTSGGILSSLCGFTTAPEGAFDPESPSFLLSDQACLTDLLNEQGYSSQFFGAASGDFQSKGPFLEAHGVEVFDRDTWLSIGAIEPFAWGQTIHDDRLFDHGRALANGLFLGDEKFFLAGLSIDTHYPYYAPGSCREESGKSSDKIENSYACSASTVAEFIRWIMANSPDPTVIIVQGDHPPAKGISSKKDIFFAFSCTGSFVDSMKAPDTVSEIANFSIEAISKCR